jgi:gluconokinase
MGVSGSGKSTVADALAHTLGWTYADADNFHSEANRLKMKQGIPLTDADRAPWLDTLQQQIDTWLANGQQAILACSALKATYRELLRVDDPRVRTNYLKADAALLRDRLQNRKNHFMGPALLESQLQTLEEPPPSQALYIDAALPLEQIVATICSHFGLLEPSF